MSEPKRIVEAGGTQESIDHQCVDRFAELMKHELDENLSKKGGRVHWIEDKARDHVLQTYYHTGKLQVAVKALEDLLKNDGSRAKTKAQEEEIREFAADVANHAMMVLDTLGLLGLPKSVKREQEKREYRDFT